MSVKRFDIRINLIQGEDGAEARLQTTYAYDGALVLHSDYAALLTRHNALVEAVKWMLYIDTPENFEGGKHIKARAEVDRLIADAGGDK